MRVSTFSTESWVEERSEERMLFFSRPVSVVEMWYGVSNVVEMTTLASGNIVKRF